MNLSSFRSVITATMPQAEAHHVTLSMERFSQHLFSSLLMQNTRITSETEVRQLVTHSRMITVAFIVM